MVYLFGLEIGFMGAIVSVIMTVLPASIAANFLSRYIPGKRCGFFVFDIPLLLCIIVNLFIMLSGGYASDIFTAKLLLGFIGSAFVTVVGCDVFHLDDIGRDNRIGDRPSIGGAWRRRSVPVGNIYRCDDNRIRIRIKILGGKLRRLFLIVISRSFRYAGFAVFDK